MNISSIFCAYLAEAVFDGRRKEGRKKRKAGRRLKNGFAYVCGL
jgi:hypothetical protein